MTNDNFPVLHTRQRTVWTPQGRDYRCPMPDDLRSQNLFNHSFCSTNNFTSTTYLVRHCLCRTKWNRGSFIPPFIWHGGTVTPFLKFLGSAFDSSYFVVAVGFKRWACFKLDVLHSFTYMSNHSEVPPGNWTQIFSITHYFTQGPISSSSIYILSFLAFCKTSELRILAVFFADFRCFFCTFCYTTQFHHFTAFLFSTPLRFSSSGEREPSNFYPISHFLLPTPFFFPSCSLVGLIHTLHGFALQFNIIKTCVCIVNICMQYWQPLWSQHPVKPCQIPGVWMCMQGALVFYCLGLKALHLSMDIYQFNIP